MLELILLLISLLGYGNISDFEGLTEDELQARIIAAEQGNNGEGRGDAGWDHPHNPDDNGNNNGNGQ